MKTYPHIRRALAGKLWYVHEQKMNEMLTMLEFRLAGGVAAPEILESIRAGNVEAAARAKASAGSGAIAVIPIYGMIMHRTMYDMSGGSAGTSCASISMALQSALADPNVGSIVLDIDSPGGDVEGVDELAAEIYQARKQKKITAVSNCLCASAAYYLAAQANEVVVSPSSLTGSIGVYTMHEDDSAMLDAMGIKLTLIKFGENKAESNSLGPLTDSARAHMQEMVDTYGTMFEKAVARGRGVKQDVVHSKFGQGRVFDAKAAVKLGLADRVGTLAEVLGQSGTAKNQGSAAAVDDMTVSSANSVQIHVDARGATDPEKVAAIIKEHIARFDGLGKVQGGDVVAGPVSKPDPVETLLPAAKADDDNSDDTGCGCGCDPCGDGDGDCSACACDACACEGCMCDSAMSKRKEKVRAREFARMRHELAVAGA